MTRKATETIRVTPENWQRLNSMKRPGESFNDVITRLVEEHGSEGNPTRMTPETAD
jgi:predicted CopG family antitoxin